MKHKFPDDDDELLAELKDAFDRQKEHVAEKAHEAVQEEIKKEDGQ